MNQSHLSVLRVLAQMGRPCLISEVSSSGDASILIKEMQEEGLLELHTYMVPPNDQEATVCWPAVSEVASPAAPLVTQHHTQSLCVHDRTRC